MYGKDNERSLEFPGFSLDESQIRSREGYYFHWQELPPSIRTLSQAIGRTVGGTCFALEKNGDKYLVTAAHCLPRGAVEKSESFSLDKALFPSRARVVLRRGDLITTQEFMVETDIALFRLDDLDIQTLQLHREDDMPDSGGVVFAVGYPDLYLGCWEIAEPVASVGRMLGLQVVEERKNRRKFMAITNSTRSEPGNSGSPLLNSRGYVLGTVIMRDAPPQLNSSDSDKAEAEAATTDFSDSIDQTIKRKPGISYASPINNLKKFGII